MWALCKFRLYLYEQTSDAITDNHALCWLLSMKDPSGRFGCCAFCLKELDICVIYRSRWKHSTWIGSITNTIQWRTAFGKTHVLIMSMSSKQRKDPWIASFLTSFPTLHCPHTRVIFFVKPCMLQCEICYYTEKNHEAIRDLRYVHIFMLICNVLTLAYWKGANATTSITTGMACTFITYIRSCPLCEQ